MTTPSTNQDNSHLSSDLKPSNQQITLNKQIPQQSNKEVSNKYELILFEVAKQTDSLFTEEQRYPVVLSSVGLVTTLLLATFTNLGTILLKPNEKTQKRMGIFGAVNLLASAGLGGYLLFKMKSLVDKVPSNQWSRIATQKQSFDKMTTEQKKQILMDKIKQAEQQKKQDILKLAAQRKQQKIQLSK